MASEVEVFRHLDDMVLLIRILRNFVSKRGMQPKELTNPFPKVIKDLYLDQSLMVEALLVADDLYGDRLTGAMITTTQDLTKGTFPKRVRDLISER